MRPIDAEPFRLALLLAANYLDEDTILTVVNTLNTELTIDPEELRPKGEWVLKDGKGNGVCSHCNRQDKIDPLATHCRYCGAKMG